MHPVFFNIPLFGLFGRESVPIFSYGVLVALGFLFGTWYVQREAKREGEDPAKALDLVFYIIIAAILGSRLLYVLVAERALFFHNPLHLFKIWQGGLVFYGGLIASLVTGFCYLKWHRLPILKFFDFFVPAVALGHAIGRLGCFMSGCCYGRPLLHDAWYAVIFPANVNSLAPAGIPLYPTQLMESAAEFLLFLALNWKLKHKAFEGQIVSLYLICYAVIRFSLELVRGDVERGFLFGGDLSTSQFIALILFVTGVGLYFYQSRQQKRLA